MTFDAADPMRLSLFWAEALDYVIQPPPGSALPPETPATEVLDAWTPFLTQAGVPPERHGSASAIEDPTGTAHGCSSSRCRRTRSPRTASTSTSVRPPD